MNLLESFRNNWNKKDFGSKQPVLLAISGGVDSIVLADLFLKSGISFGLAHCNFQLRGKDSEGDEVFVKSWAEEKGVRFFSTRFETQKFAETWKKGIQETARILRYEWLEKIRIQHLYQSVATAHHANDNAETLLINLLKGTGISGLHGIPETSGKIIRPLLFAQKEDIENYRKENHLTFRKDISNDSDKYLRNAVRIHILPVIKQYFPQAVHQLSENIFRFSQAEILYRKEVERQLKKLKNVRGKDIYIPVLKLRKTEAYETVCYELFKEYGFSSVQIPQILKLTDAESGRFVSSGSYKVIKDRDFLIITLADTEHTGFIEILAAPCSVQTENGSFHFSLVKNPKTVSADSFTAFIDASELVFPLVLRRWRTGDYFYPFGMRMKKKKLSRFFMDQKIPLHEKEKVWVLESQRRIVWVCGMRLDERFKISERTSEVLKVEFRIQKGLQ